MYRIYRAAINWYITREGDLEQAIIEAVEEARAAHYYIRGITDSPSPQKEEC